MLILRRGSKGSQIEIVADSSADRRALGKLFSLLEGSIRIGNAIKPIAYTHRGPDPGEGCDRIAFKVT